MATCIGDQFPLARNGFYYVLEEADGSFGTQISPATADDESSSGKFTKTHAVAPLSCTMGFEQSREFTETAQGTRPGLRMGLSQGSKKHPGQWRPIWTSPPAQSAGQTPGAF